MQAEAHLLPRIRRNGDRRGDSQILMFVHLMEWSYQVLDQEARMFKRVLQQLLNLAPCSDILEVPRYDFFFSLFIYFLLFSIRLHFFFFSARKTL